MVSKDGVCKSQNVSLKDLANMSGFSEALIQDELCLEGDNLTLEQLRESMMKYLDETFKEVQ